MHQPLQQLQRADFFIRGGIVYNRDPQSFPLCRPQRRNNQRYKMRRCHEVDVVRALFLQFQKNFFQAFPVLWNS